MPLPFQTLQNPVSLQGVALHCGLEVRATLLPTPTPGFRFRRRDLANAPIIQARLENVVATHHATVLQSGEATVSTTEHLLAALYGMGVSNCEIELDGPELPILDGSGRGWVELIQTAGLQDLGGERPVWRLRKPVWWEGDGAQILGLPVGSDEFRASVSVHFAHPHTPPQTFDGILHPDFFAREVAGARTFTLESWLAPLRSAGLIRGGNLENAIVFFEDGPSSPLRFDEELARHKMLDLLGDLALLLGEAQFVGHMVAIRAGHGAHRGWMQQALGQNAFS